MGRAGGLCGTLKWLVPLMLTQNDVCTHARTTRGMGEGFVNTAGTSVSWDSGNRWEEVLQVQGWPSLLVLKEGLRAYE